MQKYILAPISLFVLLGLGVGCTPAAPTPAPMPSPSESEVMNGSMEQTTTMEIPAPNQDGDVGEMMVNDTEENPAMSPISDAGDDMMEEENPTMEEHPAGDIKEFTMTAKQWEFTPSTITVNEGDRVRLSIESMDVTHGFTLAAFDIHETLEPSKNTVVEFTADRAGTYSFFCSVFCGAGHSQMRGTLIVQ
jgi:cytochrome c oxidase subunit 2